MNKPLPLHGWKYEDWLKEIEDDPYNETVVNVFRNNNSNLEDTVPIDPDTEPSETWTPVAQTPFTRFIASLEDLPFQNPMNNNNTIEPFGRLQMFPPVEEEMTWDNSTTPPALRRLTDEEINEELSSAVTKTKLFDTDDDFDDINDLTSQDSDDVFFDESILEVSINGRKRFSRENPLRGELGVKRHHEQEDRNRGEETNDEDELEAENNEDKEDLVVEDEARAHRQLERVDYALLHLTGKRRKKL